MRLNSATLRSLRFFEAAARFSSFSRAAAELSVTQGAVSHQIKYLEESLGCKLFYRLPKRVELTEQGEQFVKVVALAFRGIEEGAEAAVASTRSRTGVRLRTGPSFALRWLVPRLGKLYALHPDIKLHVIGDYGYFDPIHRDFDLAVELLQGPVPALLTEVLLEGYLIPVCSPEYLAGHAFLKTAADLACCTLLHDGDNWASADKDADWCHWLSGVGARDIDSRQGQFFTLANMAVEAALAGQGVAIGRLSLVEDLLGQGKLVSPLPRVVKAPTRYCLAYPNELADRPGVRAVIEWLREEAQRSVSRAPRNHDALPSPSTAGSPHSATSLIDNNSALPIAAREIYVSSPQVYGGANVRLNH